MGCWNGNDKTVSKLTVHRGSELQSYRISCFGLSVYVYFITLWLLFCLDVTVVTVKVSTAEHCQPGLKERSVIVTLTVTESFTIARPTNNENNTPPSEFKNKTNANPPPPPFLDSLALHLIQVTQPVADSWDPFNHGKWLEF